MDKLLKLFDEKKVKVYDLSQLLGVQTPFWPYYPPFEMKYFKRKSEHGVNAQYIQSSWHIGTHLDSPRHFVSKGKTIDQLPVEWFCAPGVVVDLSHDLDDLDVYTPEMIESKVDVHKGDILILNLGWHRYTWSSPDADEERYTLRHPGADRRMVEWLLKKKIHIWGVDCPSTDHPMNLPIGRFLGKGTFGQCERVREMCEKKFGGREKLDKMFPRDDYQLTHNALFSHECIHLENLGGQISAPEIQNRRVTICCFPILIDGAESAWCRVAALRSEG